MGGSGIGTGFEGTMGGLDPISIVGRRRLLRLRDFGEETTDCRPRFLEEDLATLIYIT